MTKAWASLMPKGFARVFCSLCAFSLLIGYDESKVIEIHNLMHTLPLQTLYLRVMVIVKEITLQGDKTSTRTWSYHASGPVARTRTRVPSPSPRLTRLYISFIPAGIEPTTPYETMGKPCALAGSLCGEIRRLCKLYLLYILECLTVGR